VTTNLHTIQGNLNEGKSYIEKQNSQLSSASMQNKTSDSDKGDSVFEQNQISPPYDHG
jgi:hypothetical protein